MGNGHRPGHRGRGHEGAPSSSSGERTLILPGEEIPGSGLRPGSGTYRVGGKLYASVLGLLQRRPPLVRVVPLSGRYIPKAHDTVVGTVCDVQGTFWLLDIAAPRWAPLHMTGTPWKIDFGETGQYLHVGDSVVVIVEAIENTGRIGVTMLGEGLGKLEGGTIVTISAAKVPRVIGRGGSMITTITRLTGAKVVVGQNGRIWVGGDAEAIRRVRECLRLIEQQGQRSGLTEMVEGYLKSAQPPPAPARPAIHATIQEPPIAGEEPYVPAPEPDAALPPDEEGSEMPPEDN